MHEPHDRDAQTADAAGRPGTNRAAAELEAYGAWTPPRSRCGPDEEVHPIPMLPSARDSANLPEITTTPVAEADADLAGAPRPAPRCSMRPAITPPCRPGTNWFASMAIGCTGWPTASPAMRTTRTTSPRRRSFGCSVRCPVTNPARSRAGCTASPPTCSWTWSVGVTASGWRPCPRTTTASRRADRAPKQVYHDARLGPDLQSALDSLAPEFRAAVVLCDIEGLSYEEIGATLGVKLGTVRSRIHRGRQAIREYLAAHESKDELVG